MSLRNLVIKDFRTARVYMLFNLGLLFVLSIVLMLSTMDANSTGKDTASTYASLEMIIYLIIIATVSRVGSLLYLKLDELYDTAPVMASLPVTRKDLVYAKYLSAAMHVVLSLLVQLLAVVIVVLAMGLWNSPHIAFAHNPVFWCSLLLILLIYNGFSFPLYFKFGLSRGVMVVTVTQFVLAFIAVTVVYNFKDAAFWMNTLKRSLEWFGDQSLTAVMGVSVIVVAAVLFVSLRLSVQAYKTLDL